MQLVDENLASLLNEKACTGLTGLNFFVRADFGHPVAHTKFQPLRLKDAEDIGWFV